MRAFTTDAALCRSSGCSKTVCLIGSWLAMTPGECAVLYAALLQELVCVVSSAVSCKNIKAHPADVAICVMLQETESSPHPMSIRIIAWQYGSRACNVLSGICAGLCRP
jgi:hypothetical protein